MEENKDVIEEQETNVINDEELKNAIEAQLSKIQNKAMVVGLKVACSSIKDRLDVFERSPGKKTNNDYKRLVKDIRKFVDQGLSDENNETVQN